MNKKKIIRKTFILGAWVVVIAGIATLLVAANRKERVHLCREVVISLKGNGEKLFIEKADISKLLASKGNVVNRPLGKINLPILETMLERNDWIRNAELYFDSRDALHVVVEEREPIARVFTPMGRSFYIDSAAHAMPLIEKVTVRLPVITGYPDVLRRNAADSLLIDRVKNITAFLRGNDFWNAQTGQLDITSERKFEIIPVVGDHVIRLGDGSNIGEKLAHLKVFYKQILSKTGFDKYSALDLSYQGQIVAVKKGAALPVDSIQLQQNINELVNKANLQNIDESMLPSKSSSDSAASNPNSSSNPSSNPIPTNVQAANGAHALNSIRSNPTENNRQQPRAVMPRRQQ